MTESETTQAENQYAPLPPAPQQPGAHSLSRRGWTVLLSLLLVFGFGIAGLLVKIPYVALGPGPTYDVLGDSDSSQVIEIKGGKTFPTKGQLRMTTVSRIDEVTLFGGLGMWISGDYALAPRDEYFRPGESDEDVKKESVKQFKDSQSAAEVAALRKLGYPVKVVAGEIVSDSPADKVLKVGDQLVVVNGEKVGKAEDVRRSLKGTNPGDRIKMTIRRAGAGEEKAIELRLAARDDREEGFIGLVARERADVPFKIDVKLADVGGPSAGLVFALAIYDQLTPGPLTNGKTIAGTGSIAENGAVERIGGIGFKLSAAAEAGAQTFLVPEGNCAEAVDAGVEGLELVRVGTLDEAIAALEKLEAGKPAPTC